MSTKVLECVERVTHTHTHTHTHTQVVSRNILEEVDAPKSKLNRKNIEKLVH